MLGSFGVTGDLALQQVRSHLAATIPTTSIIFILSPIQISSLSGGQKSRVAFSILCAHNPNFLILDEPTNHLDIQTIEALGNGLIKYKVRRGVGVFAWTTIAFFFSKASL